MANVVLDLDWRETPPTEVILDLIKGLLQHISDNSFAEMINSAYLDGRNGAQLRFVEENKIIPDDQAHPGASKLFVCEIPKPMKRKAVTYLCQLSVVASKIAQIQGKGIPTPQRLFGYYWTSKLLSRERARVLVVDLALTIKVHPYALGIIAEPRGRYSVPVGYNLDFVLCKNIFEYSNDRTKGTVAKHNNGPAYDKAIPASILSLKVTEQRKRTPGPIRAVVVLEHRNVSYILENLMKRSDGLQGIWFVMTGGFADLATREFLHLLSVDPMLKDTKFLFMSDRDPSAVEIFSNLKHGSRQASYMTLNSSCPSLTWAGVSIERYTKLANKWPEAALGKWVKLQTTPPTPEERTHKLAQLQHQTKRLMFDSLGTASAMLNAFDKHRLQHFHRYKVFSPEHEPELYKDLLAMGMNELDSSQAVKKKPLGQKFGLAKLAKLNSYGIEEAIVDVLEDHVSNAEAVKSTSISTSLDRVGKEYAVVATRQEVVVQAGENGVPRVNSANRDPISRSVASQEFARLMAAIRN